MTQSSSAPLVLRHRQILLIIAGGIAAYKSLDLIRRLREAGADVTCVLTKGGEQFVTPLSVAALSGNKVYSDLWSLTDEAEMGHIRLARQADLILVVPASANLIARTAQGFADDLASTILLATTKPIMIAPAMNPAMWAHPATQANIKCLRQRGVTVIEPDAGLMACGEEGAGRLPDVSILLNAITDLLVPQGALRGRRALVTSGATREPIDPVRYITNHSSGKQGHAIAEALRDQGADVVLVTGATQRPDPVGVRVVHVETAQEMLTACQAECQTEPQLDIAVCAAAVADWRVRDVAAEKLKKGTSSTVLELVENPDILARLAQAGKHRPALVVGFAAETQNVLENAQAKLIRKNCDWIVANNVSAGQVFGDDDNQVTLLRRNSSGTMDSETWARQSKIAIARQLVEAMIKALTPAQA